MQCVNLGCGQTPTPGWLNVDNSPSVRLAGHPLLLAMGSKLGVLKARQVEFANAARQGGVVWADAGNLPLEDGSASIVYSCHMLEHLSRDRVRVALLEIRRVLMPGGYVRLVLPDLARLIEGYQKDGDADAFMKGTYLGHENHENLQQRVVALFVGDRLHAWMYDAQSFIRLLEELGFTDVQAVGAGETNIPDTGDLDLSERDDESFYVEAKQPS